MELYFSRSCDYCRKRKIRCSRTKPSCHLCTKKGHPCTRNNPFHKRGPKSKNTRLANEVEDDLHRALDASNKLTEWLFAAQDQMPPVSWDYPCSEAPMDFSSVTSSYMPELTTSEAWIYNPYLQPTLPPCSIYPNYTLVQVTSPQPTTYREFPDLAPPYATPPNYLNGHYH
ncbi:hypothetical protein DSO57_1026787 [Entomophthora muscae]|uniref:Uncharacterized protein n=1 Tax=Entomophthora muscae TaxID=34485 RepID=A0ACC2T277_9FUNG|nr:hypothetical protein DSO57_1026787 [Entomophthora muscae]